jgi:hypothetical protein
MTRPSSSEAPPLAADELAEPDLDLDSEEDHRRPALGRPRDGRHEQYQRGGGGDPRATDRALPSVTREQPTSIIVQVFLHEAMPKVLEDKLAVMVTEDQA